MKTYNEMAQSVLQRATAGLAVQKRRRKTILGIAATGLCLALVLAAVGAFRNTPAGTTGTQPTISMENPTTAPTTQPEETEPTQQDEIVTTGNVYFLSATEDGAELAPLQANMVQAMDHLLRVRSLKGMTEHEKYLALLEERAFAGEFRKEYGKLLGESLCYFHGSDDAIISMHSGGFASLLILDNSQIESVTRESTGVLGTGENYIIYHKDHTYGEGESAVTIPAGSRRIRLDCAMTYETMRFFEENPETPLSTIRDTFTITINYKNGTKEIVVIDVTVDDDGRIYLTQRGTNTGV